MNLFNYLMAKKGHNTSVRDDLLAYLLGKRTPKEVKTATGTTISITDATREKIISLTLSKESTQDGTPTPENPVEVKTVKGYRNLFDKDSVINAYLNNDGTTTSNSLFRVSDFIELNKKSENYITIVGNAGRSEINCFYDEQKNFISNFDMSTNSTKTVEIPSNAYYVRTTVYRDNLDSYQLTEGTEELPYVPYGNNWIYEKIIGKNLYDSSYRNQNGTINGSNNTIITESDGVYSATRTDGSPLYIWSQAPSGSSYASGNGTLVEVETGVTYAITITNSLFNNNFLVTYNENKVSTGFVNRGNSFTFTPTGNTKYISMRIGMTNSEANVTYSTSVQVEKGSATEYEPYKESIVTLPLNGNEIAGIGDYKDELIVDKNGKCWLNKKTAKIDSYNGETITTNYMSTTGGLDTGATIYYVLSEPQLIDLNYTVDIELFEGVNNISNSDDMDMTLKYY